MSKVSNNIKGQDKKKIYIYIYIIYDLMYAPVLLV